MNILTANFKHLYQRRGIGVAYVFIGLLAFAFLAFAFLAFSFDSPSWSKDFFIRLIILIQFLLGLCMASLATEILTKPFSFCLPGHRKVPRIFLFSIGVVTSLLGALVFLVYRNLYWWQWVPVTCSTFCAALIMYWIGVALTFGIRNSISGLVIASCILSATTIFDLHIIAERTIIIYPFAIVLVGLAGSVMMWIWLGNSNWARRLCATPRVGIFDIWNKDRVLEFKRRREAEKLDRPRYNLDPWVERFFVRRMNRCNHLGPRRYIWGGLYTTYAMALSRWKGTLSGLLGILTIAVFFSYAGHVGTDILFLMAGVIAAHHAPLPIHSSMMISGGRRERFVTSIILAGTITVPVSAALISVTLLSMALAPIMPEITFRGELLTFHSMNLRFLIVPSIIIPIVLALRLIIYRKPLITFAVIVMLLPLIPIFEIISPRRFGALLNPVSLVSLLILSWLVLVIVLRHICMRRSLVGQSRTY